jgi:hypothetical protein
MCPREVWEIHIPHWMLLAFYSQFGLLWAFKYLVGVGEMCVSSDQVSLKHFIGHYLNRPKSHSEAGKIWHPEQCLGALLDFIYFSRREVHFCTAQSSNHLCLRVHSITKFRFYKTLFWKSWITNLLVKCAALQRCYSADRTFISFYYFLCNLRPLKAQVGLLLHDAVRTALVTH